MTVLGVDMFGFKKNNRDINVAKDVAPSKGKKSIKKGFFNFVLKIKKIKFKNIRRTMAFKFAVVLLCLLFAFFAVLSTILTKSIGKDNIETYTQFSTSVAARSADSISYWLNSFFKDLNIFTLSNELASGDYELVCDYLKNNRLCSTTVSGGK